MRFKVIGRFQNPPIDARSIVYLFRDDWDDFGFRTIFGLIYMDENSKRHDIGYVKIGFIDQNESERSLSIGDTFEDLDSKYFSLGQSDSYYVMLNKMEEIVKDEILVVLRDIAKFPNIYNIAITERVTKVSLLRFISQTSVKGQFRRIALGGARLTKYSFRYLSPKPKGISSGMELYFNVVPEVFPPTNIHVLIGGNGSGKTYIINNMISSLIDDNNRTKKYGEFVSDITDEENRFFANLILITFSAFDETEPKQERKDKTQGIQFSYIGLKRIQTVKEKNLGPKSTIMLRNEFFKSLSFCKASSKINRWKESIQMLESDPNFLGYGIKDLIDIDDDSELKASAYEIFRNLSSGHKIVLLTITRLVETLQERSLVLIDEPEAHLHPPLLSAFIRAVSELLILTNGVGIIASHSPVVLQEVPSSCVWKLRRTGKEAVAERLSIESFGENVGALTHEVFSLEVTNSGFYRLINELVKENLSYAEVVDQFNDQLGMEARAIIRTMTRNIN